MKYRNFSDISGLTCLDHRCQARVNESDACDDNHFCPDGTVCFAQNGESTCLKNLGNCTSDSECATDSYCCTDDSCSVKNFCIPYGEGPRGNINEACAYKTVPGLFEAAIQCEWKAPDASDPYPNHANVLVTPLVMDTPHDSGSAQEIIFTTYNKTDGSDPAGKGSDITAYGVIRIINAETCELHESIFDDLNHIIGGANLSAADVDNDGFVEIFASRGTKQNTSNGAAPGGGLVAFHWDKEQQKYVTWWNTTKHSDNTQGQSIYWAGSAIHDINDDGIPEIIGYGGETFNALNGERINPNDDTHSDLAFTAAPADYDNDGNVEIFGTTAIYRWDKETNTWKEIKKKAESTGVHTAYADFGTPLPNGFDFDHKDGIAELVNCGGSIIQITSLDGKTIMRVTGLSQGGPCTIGDFDGDNKPEVAAAFGDSYRIFDPECTGPSETCAKKYILWEKKSQDSSSGSTGSSLFDFDGDGAMEAVYADECYTRVYDGKTGDVLFSSYRSSSTWHEYPVIADVDNDESAEIIVGSNNAVKCNYANNVDPIHRGLRCATDSDCKSGSCKSGFCRCTEDSQCNWRTDAQGNILDEYKCVAPLDGDNANNEGNVCRAKREIPSDTKLTGVRVMKDSLDRWMSSRNLWNQHAYTITNINADQTIPKTSKWLQNFLSPTLNNFRQNEQGKTGANRAPDITGRFVGDTCTRSGEKIVLGAEICNRGTKMVSKLMPATFYKLGVDEQGQETRTLLCTSYTSANVPVGGCLHVSCTIDEEFTGDVVLVSNDDGNGGRTTVECNEDNNEDRTTIEDCPIVIN